MTWTLFMNTSQLFCRMSFILGLSEVFAYLEWVCIFGKKNITYFGKNNITYYRSDIMTFSVHLLKGFMILTCLVTDDVNLDH